ncbi:MAG: hypothetical protein ACON4J_06585 [Parvibaculales bacterium]
MKRFSLSATVLACGLALAAPALAVTDQEVAAQPFNVELNRKYAIEQLAANNLDVALAAAERVIRAAPADLDARLMRAQILIKMGRGKEAVKDLQTLAKLPLPANQLNRVNAMLRRLDRAYKKLEMKAFVRFGIKDTDNANSYPEGGKFEALSTGGTVTEFDYTDIINDRESKLGDTIINATVGVNGKYKFSEDIRDYIYFSAQRAFNNGDNTVQTDSNMTSASLGLRMTRGLNDLDIGAGYTNINQVNNTFTLGTDPASTVNVNSDVELMSLSATYTRRLTKGTRFFYNVSYSELDHSNTASADLYDSDKVSHSAGVLMPVFNVFFLRASVNYAERRARLDTDAAKSRTSRDTEGYSASVYYQPFQGHTINAFYNYSESDYLLQVSTNPRLRADEAEVMGVNYSFQGDFIHDLFEDWKMTASYMVRETDSNIMLYDVEAETFTFTIERQFKF